MMDSQKWISTLPNKNSTNEEGQYKIDPKITTRIWSAMIWSYVYFKIKHLNTTLPLPHR